MNNNKLTALKVLTLMTALGIIDELVLGDADPSDLGTTFTDVLNMSLDAAYKLGVQDATTPAEVEANEPSTIQ